MRLQTFRPGKIPLRIALLAVSMIIFWPGDSKAGFSAGFARDIIHSPETTAVILRYDKSRLGFQTMYWDGPDKENGSIAVDFNPLPWKAVELNLGGAYIFKINEINGTHLNFSAGLAVNVGKHLRFQFTHMSDAHNKNNDGWNFLAVLARF